MIYAIIALFAGANFYVFYRLWHMAPSVGAARWIILIVGILATLCTFLYFLIAGKAPHWVTSAIYRVGTSWLMIFLYLLIAFLLLDLLRLTHLVPMEWMKQGSRTALGVMTLGVAVIFGLGNIVYHKKDRAEVNIATSRLTTSVKIVAVSDLHLGYNIGNKELAKWVNMINAERPDIVLIGGDLIDTHLQPLWDKDMASELRRLKAPLGVYGVPGNHEYISGIEESVKFYDAAGITCLRDSASPAGETLYIVGRDDISNYDRKSLQLLTSGLDDDRLVILLDHQPADLNDAADNGVMLQFSGHTHKGQVWPISWITNAIFEKAHGYIRKGDTHYYISSGLGIWGGKFRIGSRSEYVVINLMPQSGAESGRLFNRGSR